MKKFLIFCLLLIFNLSYANKPNLIASTSIIGDIVQNIAGVKANVIAIVGANQDPHEYELKPSDLVKIEQSQLIFINGLGLEAGWFNQIAKSYANKTIVVTQGLNPLYAKNHQIDPHAWNDVMLVRDIYVKNILNGLIKVDPQNSQYYINNAKIYQAKLDQLNQWIITKLSTIPKDNAKAITTHDAFAYFTKAYPIQFISIQGVSTDSDASIKDITTLEKLIKQSKVKVVFLENMTNNRLINQVANDTHATIGGKLYSDALSTSNQIANTYINMMKYNVETLLKALTAN